MNVEFAASETTDQTASPQEQAQSITEQERIEREQQKAELQARIKELEQEEQKYQEELDTYHAEGDGYKREIANLNSQITQIQKEIASNQLEINKTRDEIEHNEQSIEALQERQEYQKNLLADFLLQHYKQQELDEVFILFLHDNLSDFFDEVQGRLNIQEELGVIIEEIEQAKVEIEREQQELDARIEEQVLAIGVQQVSRQELASKQNSKQQLLSQNQQTQRSLEGAVAEIQKTKAQVRSQLYTLQGGAISISFEQAYNYAKLAEQFTGVRPAFLLSLFQQESNIGKNIGSCYLVEPADLGNGINFKTNTPQDRLFATPAKGSKRNDVVPFLQIMNDLGRDPFATPISCPASYGWGGAMGPAQFIPTTWIGYKDRLRNLLGREADPFQIADAFIASAVKLADAGAQQRTRDAEWKAAQIYYAGGNWRNPRYAFYGNTIISRARTYQSDIDILEGS